MAFENNMVNENEFLDWNASFVAEENSFTLLPSGEYPFVVTNLERKIYSGTSDKIPNGAPYAEVTVEASGPEGKATVKERLYMMKKFQWKLTEFFTSIGQPVVVGQPFSPNWSTVIGSRGTVELEINSYTSQGQERKNNRAKSFKKPSANNGVVNSQQNFNQPPVQQQSFNQQQNFNQPQNQGGFQPGAF